MTLRIRVARSHRCRSGEGDRRDLRLVWGDVDFDAGLVRVRKQLDRHGQRVDPKTEESQRDVLLLPTIARVLRELKLASSYAAPSDFAFASETGTPLQARNASRRGLAKAVEAAGLNDGTRPIGWHLLRHGFGSMLLAQGENVVFVSGQPGHNVTLGVYAHEFNQADQLEQARARLAGEHGTALETALGDGQPAAASENGAATAPLRLIGD
jgi:integrase